ncbi:Dna-mediated transposase [Oopsacas minuta]|uniref:Dna-mediated transposase n=1 Tax=Oopsacas minuta TaxID=111878 RepID=A0AAV7KLE3_9METZ|nr:Dna-mediated transposase [Oopsacas minuta]
MEPELKRNRFYDTVELSSDDEEVISTLSANHRKSIDNLTMQQQCSRLSNVLESIKALSIVENTSEIKIAALALQLLSNQTKQREIAKVSKSVVYDKFSGQFDTKSFILFCFRPVKIISNSGRELWKITLPILPFAQRPIFLLAAKENEANIKRCMDDLINTDTDLVRSEGFTLGPDQQVRVDIVRSMLDGKMAGILSGAGGASCQLCTATHKELSDLETEHKKHFQKLHMHLSAILRIINSYRIINTEVFGDLCTDIYLLIVDSLPWVNITPTLHRVLAHSEEILIEFNPERGLKSFSGERSEAWNKLLRSIENLARKSSFEDNAMDIIVTLASESDPVLNQFCSSLVCEKCGKHDHTKRAKCCRDNTENRLLESSIDEIVDSLIINSQIH